jgi:hypothetical protein
MNPMKWPTWMRIAIVASILWIGFISVYRNDRFYFGNYLFDSDNIFLLGLLPVFLFWGVAWIVHGTKLWNKRNKTTKGE